MKSFVLIPLSEEISKQLSIDTVMLVTTVDPLIISIIKRSREQG